MDIENKAAIAFHITQNPITSDEMTPCISAGSTNGQAVVGVLCESPVYALDRAAFNQGINAQYNVEITDGGINSTMAARGPSAVGVKGVEYTVRRLTPLECERLQGYPSGWTDIGAWTDENGKSHAESTDAARYKAIGNSIALPPWEYVLQRLSICCGDNVTMASLFDGIGGFPLIWERLNGAGACLWASEIEEFPIAVTKRHFSEVQGDEQGFL
ncbi:hypothetical protein FACS1894208_05390 [Clostridia bacterium]|nr:hypothetical protein FACS1894208_05390 [Clostridia bacterium]